jgi:DNA-directed DNA polymerase III PolC
LSAPAELARAAAAFGMPSLALTDFISLTGAVEFYDACRDLGVKPILGLEIDVTPPPGLPRLYLKAGRLALLALDMHGWSSLCKLSSALLTDPAYENDLIFPFDRLSEFTGGVLCLAGGWQSQGAAFSRDDHEQALTEALGQLADIYPDRFYLGIEDPALMPLPLESARSLNLPLVAAPSVYYLDPDGAHLQKVVTAVRLNCRLDQVPKEEQAPPGASFLSPDEMAKRYAEFPRALAATQEIAERCQLELPLGVPHHPEIPLPPDATPEQVLRQRAEAGARRLYDGTTPDIQSRLDHELDVIAECGYAALFLVMEEILQHARRIGVPYSSRGSAASSLVAHCLGITSPDPLRLNLYFERFLNPARLTPPDIDTDLCSRRRDEVIRFVYERFGDERVAMVCTINRYRRRSALRDVAKAHGLPPTEINKLVEALPQRWYGPPPPGYREGSAFEALSQRYTSEAHQTIFRDAAALLDKPRHLSIHPGGVVIAPGRLTDLVPTRLASKGVVITQFDLDAIERLGLIKIDLLGIRGLTVLGDVAQTLQAAHPGVYTSSLDALDSIPLDDPPTSELVQHGRTIGCFQIESPGMRATLKEIRARAPDDLMVALALYRPGPLTGGLKDAFVRRHRGEEQAAQLHPVLGPLLEDTYGVILYQEQVLRIAHELGGFSLVDADLLRRAMSHFDPGKQMQTLKEKFIAGAMERGGVPADIAERVWELMAAFAGYGFPKAHAASYAQVAWHSAWCKAHHPAVFMAAVLANWGGYYGQRVYLTEARRLGLALRPPHVNFARRDFSVVYQQDSPVLYMGLDQVRDLTSRTIERIQRLRPFTSLDDFLRRSDPRPVEVENLARVGALQGFGTNPELLRRLKGKNRLAGQLSLFALDEARDDWSLEEKVAAQEDVLGVGVDAHPLELVKDQITAAGAINTLEAAERVGQKVRVAGMRQTWRRFATARGDYMYFMSLEDLEGMLDVVISSTVYQRCRLALKEQGPYIVEGGVERDSASGEPFIRAGNVSKIS